MDQSPDQSVAILKELSDIKSALAVNTNETANIKQRVTELQVDVKEMKSDSVTPRELDEKLAALKEDISFFKKIVYSSLAFMAAAIATAIFKLIFK